MGFSSGAEYHRATEFSRWSLGGGGMDRSNRPSVFKEYPQARKVRLNREVSPPDPEYFSLAAGKAEAGETGVDFDALSAVLMLAHGVTATAGGMGGRHYFRSVPSAGALYPVELYLAAGGIQGLADGVYHHHVLRQELSELRSGDFSAYAAGAAGSEPSGLLFFISGLFFRSSWKYGGRAYRYCLLDAGHLAESLALALKAHGLRCSVMPPQDPHAAEGLLCLDPEREGALLAVSVDVEASPSEPLRPGEPSEELLRQSRCAPRDKPAPEILEAQETAVGGAGPAAEITLEELGLEALERLEISPRPPDGRTLLRTIAERRSQRRFRGGMDRGGMDSLLAMTAVNFPAMRSSVVVRGVQGAADGLYVLEEGGAASLAKRGDLHDELAGACLGQRWMTGAPLIFAYLTDLEALERFGPGGYALALAGAGRAGHRAYMAATAMGMGACGVGAFFDLEAAEVLGLGQGSRVLYLVTAGPPA